VIQMLVAGGQKEWGCCACNMNQLLCCDAKHPAEILQFGRHLRKRWYDGAYLWNKAPRLLEDFQSELGCLNQSAAADIEGVHCVWLMSSLRILPMKLIKKIQAWFAQTWRKMNFRDTSCGRLIL
jgi:hypothetical protein